MYFMALQLRFSHKQNCNEFSNFGNLVGIFSIGIPHDIFEISCDPFIQIFTGSAAAGAAGHFQALCPCEYSSFAGGAWQYHVKFHVITETNHSQL